MSELNKRLLSELFLQKEVSCSQKEYRQLYYKIWPCEEYFKEFLLCSNTDLKIEYGKKIYESLRVFDDIFLPEFIVNNVLELQFSKLVDNVDAYVPQDHFIHCINLYITGIYLFFNVPILHKKLLLKATMKKPLYERIDSFIWKWRLFAFYHDVGYYYESNIDVQGYTIPQVIAQIKEYDTFYIQLLFEYVTRSVARTLTTISLVKNTAVTFNLDIFSPISTVIWEDENGSEYNTNKLYQELKYFEGSKAVDGIQFDAILANFSRILDNQEYLILILDEEELLVGLVAKYKNEAERIYLAQKSQINLTRAYYGADSKQLLQTLDSKYEWRCCIRNIDDIIFDHIPIEYKDLAKKFDTKLPRSLQTALSYMTSAYDVSQCYFKVYQWLSSKATSFLDAAKQISEHEVFKEQSYKIYMAVVNDFLSAHINKFVKNWSGDIDDLESLLPQIGKDIERKTVVKQLSKDIRKAAIQQYDNEGGIHHDIYEYYRQTYFKLLREKVYSKSIPSCATKNHSLNDMLETLQLFRIDKDEKIQHSLFSHGTSSFETKLYSRLQDHARALDVKLQDLTAFSWDHSSCDHGLISAGILFQAIVFAQHLVNENTIQTAWCGNNGQRKSLEEVCPEDYSDVVFAVLLHNVYTKKFSPVHGVDYHHNINKDAFSFFCMFCDTLQKWNRPKQIDYSKTGLPINHYLGEKFDITCINGKIYLKCSTQDAALIRDSLVKEDLFLPGMSNIIEIVEF